MQRKEDNADIKHATKISTYTIYDLLTEIPKLKAVLTVEHIDKACTQMAKLLFDKLDVLAETINGLYSIEFSERLFFIKRVSVSPTRKFQLWIINDAVILFTNSEAWHVFQSVLFFEGELFIKKVTWDENIRTVCMQIFYIVHDKYVNYKVSFAASNFNIFDDVKEDMGSALETMMAYSEIYTILNVLEDSYASRVPRQLKAFFEEERLKDYEPQIDLEVPLTEQNLQRKTIVLLGILEVNYWCDSKEEREFWLREMATNADREYNPNDMFWDLGRIFDKLENIYDDDNDEYPTKFNEEWSFDEEWDQWDPDNEW